MEQFSFLDSSTPNEHPMLKRCSNCGTVKPICEFYSAGRGIGRIRADCKTCVIDRMRVRRDGFARQNPPETPGELPVTRVCRRCGKVQPINEFGRAPRSKTGWRVECAACRTIRRECLMRSGLTASDRYYRGELAHPGKERASKLRRMYGIGPEDFARFADKQGGRCAICGGPQTRILYGRLLPLDVDHDHDTGQVRGLLCTPCNVGIGALRSDPALLRAAAAYLETH